MAKGKIEVTVGCKLTVSDETADNCLKLLEIWQNDNPDKHIEVRNIYTEEGRKTIFSIVCDEE